MNRRGALLAATLVAIVGVAGCNVSLTTPAPSHTPVALPTPVGSPTADELLLLSGIRLDAGVDCAPVREGLPAGATGAVECVPNTAAVDRFRVTLFSSTNSLLTSYVAEMASHGVGPNSGTCSEGKGDSNYVPGPVDASVPYRHGCFVDGIAQYRATVPDAHVSIAIAGQSADVSQQLQAYAWEGNEDTPGAPTLWRAP